MLITEDQSGTPLIGAAGPSLTVFHRTSRSKDGTEEWSETTRWVNLQEAWVLTHVARCLMQNLWTVARFRYLAVDANEEPVYLPTDDDPLSIRLACPTHGLDRMSIRIATRELADVPVLDDRDRNGGTGPDGSTLA